MRPILAIIVAISVLGCVRWFLASRTATNVTPSSSQERLAEGSYTAEILLTFEAGPDPFAGRSDAPSLAVRLRNQTLLNRTDPIPANTAIRFDALGVVEGRNEFFVEAVGLDDDPNLVRAVRLRVFRDEQLVVEEWLSSAPGQPVLGPVVVEVPPSL